MIGIIYIYHIVRKQLKNKAPTTHFKLYSLGYDICFKIPYWCPSESVLSTTAGTNIIGLVIVSLLLRTIIIEFLQQIGQL